ncbi:TcfC E-set like domain-containing protein [Vibrio alginolyticus]|uniref:TcfC E-set like domain-containing protein n=1 Tax=Vibrio alginolyticus TaxID=663 RepID=UPI001BD365E5|nr:TcfC E-set like domain-containing protein [Vibrio alginolyticus]MBS9848127.1 TcfC E-set like domain-containing protein [Vibrio alginolyticus]
MKNDKFLASFLLVISTSLSGSPVPDEFKSLFELQERKVNAVGLDGQEVSLSIFAGYDFIQIKDEISINRYKNTLIDAGIQNKYVNEIISDLKLGRKNKPVCTGLIEKCNYIPENYEIYFDYYTNNLYLYINPSLLEIDESFTSDSVAYVDAVKTDWSLINSFDFYTNLSKNNDNSFNVYNKSLFGMPHGHVVSDFEYGSSDSKFDLNELTYTLENDRYQYILGLSENGVDINSTSFMNSYTGSKEIGFTVGTSKNLVKGPKNRTQKLFFFAPNDGVLTIYRNNKIIYQKNVSSGQGFITNDELPRGRYDAIFVISSGGNEVSREVKSIYNTGSNRLAVGSYDSTLTVGVLDEEKKHNRQHDYSGDGFFRSMIAYRPFNSVMIGAGALFLEEDSAFNIGIDAYLPMQSRLTVVGQHFMNNSNYYDLSLSSLGWNFSYQKFSASQETDLARYFYGNSDYSRMTIGKGFHLPYSVDGYINYSKYKSEEINSAEYNKFKSSLVSLGLSTYVYSDIAIQLNVDYDLEEDNNDVLTQLSINIPLGENYSANSRVSYKSSELNGLRTNLKRENLFASRENIIGNMSVGHNYIPGNRDKHVYDASLNATLTDDKYLINSYLYTDSNDNASAVGSFSSTQIITSNNIAATKDKANSYVIVDAQNKLSGDGWKETNKGLFVLEENGRIKSKKLLKNNKEVVPLRDYEEYRSFIDSDVVGLQNSGENHAKLFSLPGSVEYIKTDMSRVISFISGFRDIFDQEVEGVQCNGDACIAGEMLTRGIYKISVKEGIGFFLGNDELVCLIPPVKKSSMLNFGYNYCLPKLEPMEQYVSKNRDESISLTFVGGFEKSDYDKFIKKEIYAEIMSERHIIEKEVNEVVYVYIKSQNIAMSKKQLALLNDIQKLAKDVNMLKDNSEITLVNRY